jgi:hypothetical protein
MATRLRNLRLKTVSLVDEPANPDATVVLYKRKEIRMADQTAPPAAPPAPAEPAAKAATCPNCGTEGAGKFCADCGASLSGGDTATKALEKRLSAASEEIAKARAEAESAQKRAAEAEQLAKFERDTRRKGEFVAKAAAYSEIAAADKLGPALMALTDAAPDAAKVIEEVLASANAVVKESRANGSPFVDRGAGRGPVAKSGDAPVGQDTDAMREIQKRAAELVSTGKAKTLAAAVTMVGRQDPALVAKHRRELKESR